MSKTIIGIYKIINLINNKIYIGQSVDINRRFNDHLNSAYNIYSREYNTPIHCAIRKYGKENFKLEIIEQCNSDELNSKEEYWINFFKSNDRSIGYNLTAGGLGGHKQMTKPVLQYDLDGNFIKEWSSIWLASETLNIGSSNIRSCCSGQKSAGGFQWKYKNDNKIIKKYKRNTYYPGLELGRKPCAIMGISINNKEKICFNSITEAAQWLINNNYSKSQLNSLRSRISTIKDTQYSCCGFYWKKQQGDDD